MRVYLRDALASRRWQLPQKYDDRPKLVVAQYPFRAGHSRGADSVVEDPFKLSVGIALYLL